MMSDAVRMDAYAAALRKHIRSDSIVLDIGTGTGIFALLACQYGARRVYAVEPSVAIQVARELAAANGYVDRIVFINDFSTRVSLPEQADVVISDLRSVLPFFQNHFETIVDARRRLLAPGGVMIPQRDDMWSALVSSPDLYRSIVGPYLENPFQLDLRAPLRYITNEWRKGSKLTAEDLFMEPQRWVTLDYAQREEAGATGELVWTANRAETVYGFCVWFDAVLSDGIGFSNAPGAPNLIYRRAFFPWSEPVDLTTGDHITISLTATFAGGEYVWNWETRIGGTTGTVKAEFQQSTFNRSPLSLRELRKRTNTFVPRLSETAQIHSYVLKKMETGITIGEIARQLSERYPDRFPDQQDALHEVAELSQRYSE